MMLKSLLPRWTTAFVALAVLGLAASAAQATPQTFTLTPSFFNRLTTVNLTDVAAPIESTGCEPGFGDCLAAPVPIDSATVTVDTDTGGDTVQLLGLSIVLNGTGVLDMNGINGTDTVEFTGTSFLLSFPVFLTGDGSGTRFIGDAPGSVQIASLVLEPDPGAGFPFFYANAAVPEVEINFSGGEIALSLNGVLLGEFIDPLTGLTGVEAKADFFFTAAIPEPQSALVFVIGVLVAGTAILSQRTASEGTA